MAKGLAPQRCTEGADAMAGSQAHKKGTLMRSRVFTPPATFALRCILAGCSALAATNAQPIAGDLTKAKIFYVR